MADISNQIKKTIAIIKLTRPIHWVKNVSIFAAITFSGLLTDEAAFSKVFMAFIVFNLAASSTYALNDVFDADKDKKHPIKKNRPIASGALKKSDGLLIAILLATTSLVWSYQLSVIFFWAVFFYLILQLLYSSFLKNLHIIDILVIAAGFVIRVYAGAFVINVHLSVWFLLTVLSVALFLASGKRRAELGAVGASANTRKSLHKYSKELLSNYVTMFGSSAWLSWSLFTFFESPKISTPFWLILAEFSQTITFDKMLMITIPIAIFGIMRYQALIFEERAETPEKLLLTDIPLITSIVIWVFTVTAIFYSGFSRA